MGRLHLGIPRWRTRSPLLYALSQKWEGCFPTEAALDLLMRRAADDIALRSPADRDAVTAWYAARYPVVVRIAS